MSKKYEITNITTKVNNKTLYKIKALKSFASVSEGDEGGYIEKEENLSQDGDAWVSGDAWVYGDARVSGAKKYTKGWFIGGDDSEKITVITDQTGTDYWKVQYVLGDYKIEDIEETPQEPENNTIIELNGKKYKLIEE